MFKNDPCRIKASFTVTCSRLICFSTGEFPDFRLQQQAFKNETASRAGHHSKLRLYLLPRARKKLQPISAVQFCILDTSWDQSKEMSPLSSLQEAHQPYIGWASGMSQRFPFLHSEPWCSQAAAAEQHQAGTHTWVEVRMKTPHK